MSMNPRETTEKIKGDYKDYIKSIVHVRDRQISRLAEEKVAAAPFTKGPYLEITLPFEEGNSLEELAEEGIVSREFSKMEASVHYSDWKLRIHQENALRHIITEQRNMVVSTGTGSGKTECYLYPIFNSLMREIEMGSLDAGVRALLIFPMNALANDQQKKLRKLLKSYPQITFGRYTGETAHAMEKETPQQAEKRLHDEYDSEHTNDQDPDLRQALTNELMCREWMAENPPHILLTNYAMLEYMLLRPDTAPFFDNSSAKNWRFIVIDEAHTYKGANGTEIAFLLRRLKERICHHMHGEFRCIATSATLGSEDAKPALAEFAQNLFGEPFCADDIITTKRKCRTATVQCRDFKPDDYLQLKETIRGLDESVKGKYLYDELITDRRLFTLYDALRDKPKCIEDVAKTVFRDITDTKLQEDALINLVELSAAARKSENDSALLPARYHLFVKSLEGMFVQLYPQKDVFFDRRESVCVNGGKYSVFELANCQRCEQEYIVGKTENGYLVQTSNTDKPELYFLSSSDRSILEEFDEDDGVEENEHLSNLSKYHLCLVCGRITPFEEKHPIDCCEHTDSGKIVTVYQLVYRGTSNESNCCPCCGATKKGLIKRFLTANQPATFAVAKSLYEAIPPRPLNSADSSLDDTSDISWDDLFVDDPNDQFPSAENSENFPTDESGRKLLIFSDNRQEAAFFAGFFEKKYNLIMWRKVILNCLRAAENGVLCVDDLISRVTNEAERIGLFSYDLKNRNAMSSDQKEKQAAQYVMQEFLSPDNLTGLEGLGYITIDPMPIRLKEGADIPFGLTGDELWNLLHFMMDTLRQKGAVSYPTGLRADDDFFSPRNHQGYFRETGSKSSGGSYIYGFVPGEKSKNKRLSFVYKLLSGQDCEGKSLDEAAREKLSNIYKLLLKLERIGYIIKGSASSFGTVYYLNYAKWNVHLVNPSTVLYQCNKCGRIYSYSIKDFCPEMKCDGKLERIRSEDLQKEPYSSRLFADSKVIPMLSREHTAQLSSKTAGEYQKDFEDGRINVLSCSTTFEMGVDVGELEATFLRNVPPETSNYIQRAGRAGRRTSSAAFSVTFSRRSSHDLTFYNDPTQIISGKIPPPILEISNEKIAERHLNSIVVGWFFKRHPEYFSGRTRKVVSSDSECNMGTMLRTELEPLPQDLLSSIHTVFPESVCSRLCVDEGAFVDRITGVDGSLTKAIAERSANIKSLQAFDNEATASKRHHDAIAAENLIRTLEAEASISFLSAKGVLPKYGFPIDTVSLDVLSGSTEDAQQIDLTRDLKMAISEFAPPSSIVANNKVWQSYAINTIPDKGWPTYVYYECRFCKKIYPPRENMVDIFYDLKETPGKSCSRCGQLLTPRKFIIPIFGFSTKMGEKPKPVGDTKPSSYYSTQIQFWGVDEETEDEKAAAKHDCLQIGGKNVQQTYSPGGKLFILNRGTDHAGIYVCPQCGFACSRNTQPVKGKHETKFRKKCTNSKLELVSLGHEFSTDILKIELPGHEVFVNSAESTAEKDQLLSVLYAILEGASKELHISRNDIDGCISENDEIILFDDTPGGSGFVKQIYHHFEAVLKAARDKVSGTCGCTEETSCYGCLRNYSNQNYHDSISRGLAFKYLDWLLDENSLQCSPHSEPVELATPAEETIGLKKSNFSSFHASPADDTCTQLERLLEDANDKDTIAGLKKLLEYAQGKDFENPVIDDRISLSDLSVWPELMWGKSQVAVFTKERISDYNQLKKYDWYCYLLDENINAAWLFSHVKKGG